jgi:hypothetical protein
MFTDSPGVGRRIASASRPQIFALTLSLTDVRATMRESWRSLYL